MPRVSDWFAEFSTTLQARSGRTDWPDVATLDGQVYWDDFEAALDRVGATFAQADAASSSVCDLPDLWPNQYRPLIVEAVKVLQKRAVADSRADPGCREAAILASKDCPDCDGSGIAVRYVHAEIADRYRTARGNPSPVGSSFSIWCGCPHGRFLAAANAAPGQPAVTIADDPTLRIGPVAWSDRPDSPYRFRPADWDSLHGRPMPPEAVIETVADLRHLVASLRGREGGAGASAEEPLMPDSILAPERPTGPPGRFPAEPLEPEEIVLGEDSEFLP